MLLRKRPVMWGTRTTIALLFACGALTACVPGSDGSPVYYVPLPGPSAPASGSTSASGSPDAISSPSAEATFAPAADWAETCSAIDEFKDVFVADPSQSRKVLKQAGVMAPEPQIAADLKNLAKELKVSPERFSVALVGEPGRRVNSAVTMQCGTPLIAEYSLDYQP